MKVQPQLISLHEHPRASGGIRRAKAQGGLAGFLLVAAGGWLHGGLRTDVLLDAVAGGIAGYFLVWAVALAVWRQLLHAEAATVVSRATERRRAQDERAPVA
ncbi:MAG: hypothetical protein ACJ757_09430 [Gaiellaceae bacterium]